MELAKSAEYKNSIGFYKAELNFCPNMERNAFSGWVFGLVLVVFYLFIYLLTYF